MTNDGKISSEVVRRIIERIMAYADDAKGKLSEAPQDVFYQGKDLAYVEMIDVIRIELEANGEDVEEYGLEEE
ncbi:MAG: hypothetical protein IJI19_06110 [Ruminococcus sp.]|nr:hypothetical protein [Ruminococcus sp.]